MPKRLAVVACAAVLAASPAFGLVEVVVTRVGFPTLRSGRVVRPGHWTPVVVDLALVDQASFDGSVRVSQMDNDGDQCFDRVDVHLRAETGGSRRVVLYVPAYTERGEGSAACELLTPEGEPIQFLSAGVLSFQASLPDWPVAIPDDDVLILSVSEGTLGSVADLADLQEGQFLERTPHLAHISPHDFPEHWIGLEAVDYIVWDDARPEGLTPRQLHALIEWVRHGGTLLIAASRTAGSFALVKPLDAVMPVEINEIVGVRNVRDFRRRLLGRPSNERVIRGNADAWLDTEFPVTVPVATCALRPGAARIPDVPDNDSSILTGRREGNGRIVFCGIVLRDLFSAPGDAVSFFRNVFHLRRLADENAFGIERVSLFPNVVSAVSFSTSAGAYLLAAGLASLGYVVLATFGIWSLLRGPARRHSWTAFALTAVVAAIVAAAAVNALQGFGDALHQVSVIDADAGSRYGRGTVLFGLKTSAYKELDVWLPSNPLGATEPGATDCFLRPFPPFGRGGVGGATFADARAYRLLPASALLERVPMRATLKQFEGRWQGPLRGALDGSVVVAGRRITDDSFIISELGVDLDPCYLIHSALDLDNFDAARDNGIYVYDVGPVASDGQRIRLAPRCYKAADGERIDEVINDSKLALYHKDWARGFASLLADFGMRPGTAVPVELGDERTALLLISTIGDFDHASLYAMRVGWRMPSSFSRSHFRHLDIREHLQPGKVDERGRQIHAGSAVLIGFADDAGPVRLFRGAPGRDFAMLEPDPRKSWAMYRIRIPTTHVKSTVDGRPGEGPGSAGDDDS